MELLTRGLQQLNIKADPKTIETFRLYMEGILEWNDKINLTAITDKNDFIQKHYIDSLLCVGFPEFKSASKVIDVGTGAGFPGIPLAILFPEKEFTLLDSLKKRLNVIDSLCEKLEIRNVRTLHGRAEDAARDRNHREAYDLTVSRAVANLAVLSEYTLPFIKVGGYLLAYKGSEIAEELLEAEKAIHILGGTMKEERSVEMAGLDLKHKIIVIKKTKNTPFKYPRKAGTPTKEPLK